MANEVPTVCEFMGLSFARPISADFSRREFARRTGGECPMAGASPGIPTGRSSWLGARSAGRRARFTGISAKRTRALFSPIYIAHVRHKTVGGAADPRGHPPLHALAAGILLCPQRHDRDLAGTFPWGGSARRRDRLGVCLLSSAGRASPAETDLGEPKRSGRPHAGLWPSNRLGKLSCLLSDGDRLTAITMRPGTRG